MRIGIDFGTTHTVVAASDRGNYPVVGFETEAGDVVDWFPSVVAERAGELRFGFAALAAAAEPGWTRLGSFKRALAAADLGPNATIAVGGTRLPLAELLVRFLEALHDHLRHGSNLPRRRRRDDGLVAVVAAPANAHAVQRFLTLDAFRRAGFEVPALLNEPSAAGFEYAHRFRNTLTAAREHVAVYDLGGGTFDSSLLRMTERRHEVVATAGIARLGGDDFDAVLAGLVLDELDVPADQLGPRGRQLLQERCRAVKEALTPQARRVVVETEGLEVGGPREVGVPVARFYDACAPLVARTVASLESILGAGPSAAAEPVDLHDVAGVYVVGGASALPLVGRTLREQWGRRVHRSPYPFAATAVGLAIAGDPEAGFQLHDRYARHFGVFREALGGRGLAFDAIVGPDTPLPAAGAPVTLRRVYHAAHNVAHFRFAECRALDGTGLPAGDLVPFGEVLFPVDRRLREGDVDLARVPVRRTGEDGPLIEERYRVDAGGIVNVTVTDLETGYAREVRLGS
jgi:molecular chaperone DnaK (HSP70)